VSEFPNVTGTDGAGSLPGLVASGTGALTSPARWYRVEPVIAAALAADGVIEGIFGGCVRKAGVHNWSVPCVEYDTISGVETELWAPQVIQFNVYTESMGDLRTAERQIRRLFEQELPVRIGGVYMWAMYIDAANLEGPERQGYYARGLRFEFSPLRDRLAFGRS
jgi:hypothetical protein